MKHLTLGIGILAVLLVLCLGASWTMDRTSDQVAALLESAWEQADRENLQAAAEQVEAAHRTWEQHRGISASLVDHQRLEDIDQGFTDLQAWFQLGEEAEFAQSCLALAQHFVIPPWENRKERPCRRPFPFGADQKSRLFRSRQIALRRLSPANFLSTAKRLLSKVPSPGTARPLLPDGLYPGGNIGLHLVPLQPQSRRQLREQQLLRPAEKALIHRAQPPLMPLRLLLLGVNGHGELQKRLAIVGF